MTIHFTLRCMLAMLVLLLSSQALAARFTWTNLAQPAASYLNAVASSANRLVAVGDSGVILTSSDARQWQSVSSGSTPTLVDVAYGDSQFVAVGGNGSVLFSDASAQTWNAATLPMEIEGANLFSVVYHAPRWLITGVIPDPLDPTNSPQLVAASADLQSWDVLILQQDFPSISNLIAGSGVVVGTGSASDIALPVPFPLSTTNGVEWNSAQSVWASDAAFDGSRFVVSGMDQGSATVSTSVNGSNWSELRFPELGDAVRLLTMGAGAPGYLVMASDAESVFWYSSDDLQTWQLELVDNVMLDMVAWRDNWVGVGFDIDRENAGILIGEPVPGVPTLSLAGLLILLLLLPLAVLLSRRFVRQDSNVTSR